MLALQMALVVFAGPATAQEHGGTVPEVPAVDARALKTMTIGLFLARCGRELESVDEWALDRAWTSLQQLGYTPERIHELARMLPSDCSYQTLDNAILAADQIAAWHPVETRSVVAEPVVSAPASREPAAVVPPPPVPAAAEPVENVSLPLEPVLLDPAAPESLRQQALGRFYHRCAVDPHSAYGRQAGVQWEMLLELGYTPERIDELSRLIDRDCDLVTFRGAILVARNVEAGDVSDLPEPSPIHGEDGEAAGEPQTNDPPLQSGVDLDRYTDGSLAGGGTILGVTMSLVGTGLLFAAERGPAPVGVGVSLLVTGVPTFLVGTVHLGISGPGSNARYNNNRWRVADACRILQMFHLIPGVAMNAAGFVMAAAGNYGEAPGTLIALGGTMSASGLILSAMGDNAVADLHRQGMESDLTPGVMLLGAGILHTVTGAMLLFTAAFGAAMDGTFGGNGSWGTPFAVVGLPYLVCGISMMIGATTEIRSPRWAARGPQGGGSPRHALLGVAPLVDLRDGTRGLSLVLKF